MTTYALKEIQPNPFRKLSRYPIQKEKVAALRESIRTTTFWDNIVCREVDGVPQIAYGHHRLVALRAEFPPDTLIDLIRRDLSDELMLQIMGRENMDEWGTSATVEQETVRAVVEAFGNGQIALGAVDPQASVLRVAPSFVSRERGSLSADELRRAYNAVTVGRFLGWQEPSGRPQRKVGDAITALELIEQGILAERDFAKLTTKQAGAVVEQTRQARAAEQARARQAERDAEQARREAERAAVERDAAEARIAGTRGEQRDALAEAARVAEQQRVQAERRRASEEAVAERQRAQGAERARSVGQHVSSQLREGAIGYREAAVAAASRRPQRAAPPPHIDRFAVDLAAQLARLLDEPDPRTTKLAELIRFRGYLGERERANLVRTLEALAGRAIRAAEQLSLPAQVSPAPERAELTARSA